MTTDELRGKISQSKNPEWFDKVEFTFYNDKINYRKTLMGLPAIFEYVSQQDEGWKTKDAKIPNFLESNKNSIGTLKNRLESFVQTSILLEKNNLNASWNNDIINLHNGQYIPYELSEISFLINLDKSHPGYSKSAYNFLFGNIDFQHQGHNKDYIIGVLMAYEFLTKDSSEILSRKSLEVKFLNDSKRDFGNYLNEVENEIRKTFTIVNAEKLIQIDDLEKLKEKKEKAFDTWHTQSKNEFDGFNSEAISKIKDLESTYQDLLRLKEPAKYWEDRATQLKKEAKNFLTILIILLSFGGLCLYFLLWQTPEGMLKSFFNDDKTIAVRWSIVFITFISLIFIGLRVVSKVMFSSYHLARDAEERQQLTYVYLALKKDASVDEKDRQLIMQSLFSRADTGLLKEDSSPTMPGGLDKFFNK